MTIQKYVNLNTLIAFLSICIIIAYFNKEFGKAQKRNQGLKFEIAGP